MVGRPRHHVPEAVAVDVADANPAVLHDARDREVDALAEPTGPVVGEHREMAGAVVGPADDVEAAVAVVIDDAGLPQPVHPDAGPRREAAVALIAQHDEVERVLGDVLAGEQIDQAVAVELGGADHAGLREHRARRVGAVRLAKPHVAGEGADGHGVPIRIAVEVDEAHRLRGCRTRRHGVTAPRSTKWPPPWFSSRCVAAPAAPPVGWQNRSRSPSPSASPASGDDHPVAPIAGGRVEHSTGERAIAAVVPRHRGVDHVGIAVAVEIANRGAVGVGELC